MRTRKEIRMQSQRVPIGNCYLRPSEYRVIQLYIDGIRQSEMLSILGCSVKTINSHIRHAKERLGSRTIHQLIATVAASDAIKGLGSPSNREKWGERVIVRAKHCVDAHTVPSHPELPSDRAP